MMDAIHYCGGIPQGFYEDPGLTIPWTLRESGEVPHALYYHRDNERVVKAALAHIRMSRDFIDINQQLAAVRTITAVDIQTMDNSENDSAGKLIPLGDKCGPTLLPDLGLSEFSGLQHQHNLATASKEGGGLMKRMSVALPPEVAALLEELATSQGVTQVEALRMAIKTEAFLQGEIRAGCKVVLVGSDGTQREVVFR